MKYYCNPMNLEYRYQFMRSAGSDNLYTLYREAADPSLIRFKDQYYLFPSMTAGYFTSSDLHEWTFQEFLQEMPIYDYAPDVRVIGEYLYFSASKRDENCSFFRTRDPLHEPFEEIAGTFPFWDPNLFQDDDGKVYFYWGCTNVEPIYGVELDPETMKPKSAPLVLFDSSDQERGYERTGEDHIVPKTEEQIWETVEMIMQNATPEQKEVSKDLSEEEQRAMLYKYLGNRPFIEGAWMTKYKGKYYLQYAIPGTEFNVYCDGVYMSDSPLGPFIPAKNNPYSYKPGGFITGAGHGSTLEDAKGNYWHAASLRISHNRNFERRLGLWKAGFDNDGELYCDQRYGDWPINMEKSPFTNPEWMLLSYQKAVTISSGTGAECITDEDIRTFARAETNRPGEWAVVDLGKDYDVRAIQINFADDQLELDLPAGKMPKPEFYDERYLDTVKQKTCWFLEGSQDGDKWFVLVDKRAVETDYAHDFLVWEEGCNLRYVRLTVTSLPYHAVPCISGIRVFGISPGELPKPAQKVAFVLDGELDMVVSWQADDAIGANILWGHVPDKLYHSYLVYGAKSRRIGALLKGEPVYARVDVFNENGIAEGTVVEVRE